VVPTEKGKALSINEKLVRAASHPIRVAAFSMMAERSTSPAEVAKAIDEEVSNVGYHVRQLEKLEMIELVDTKQRRGATEHFYRAIERPLVTADEWARFDQDERAGFSTYIVQAAMMDIARALAAGTFDRRDDRHLSRTPMILDQQGWEDAVQLHADTLYRSLEIQAEATARMAGTEEERLHVYSQIYLFEAPPPGRSG
jgi:DNA-binding transcriptional ArsR family regulator